MDGVLSNTYSRLFELYEAETGIRMDPRSADGKLEEEAFPNQRRWVTTPGFFRDLPVMEGSREGLERLCQVYDVVVNSLATEFPGSLTDKQLWLNEHFPFLSWKQIVFCGNKSLIKADVMIDDHLKNLNSFKGKTIMFTQPNNTHIQSGRHIRVASWKEIEKLLLNTK